MALQVRCKWRFDELRTNHGVKSKHFHLSLKTNKMIDMNDIGSSSKCDLSDQCDWKCNSVNFTFYILLLVEI